MFRIMIFVLGILALTNCKKQSTKKDQPNLPKTEVGPTIDLPTKPEAKDAQSDDFTRSQSPGSDASNAADTQQPASSTDTDTGVKILVSNKVVIAPTAAIPGIDNYPLKQITSPLTGLFNLAKLTTPKAISCETKQQVLKVELRTAQNGTALDSLCIDSSVVENVVLTFNDKANAVTTSYYLALSGSFDGTDYERGIAIKLTQNADSLILSHADDSAMETVLILNKIVPVTNGNDDKDKTEDPPPTPQPEVKLVSQQFILTADAFKTYTPEFIDDQIATSDKDILNIARIVPQSKTTCSTDEGVMHITLLQDAAIVDEVCIHSKKEDNIFVWLKDPLASQESYALPYTIKASVTYAGETFETSNDVILAKKATARFLSLMDQDGLQIGTGFTLLTTKIPEPVFASHYNTLGFLDEDTAKDLSYPKIRLTERWNPANVGDSEAIYNQCKTLVNFKEEDKGILVVIIPRLKKDRPEIDCRYFPNLSKNLITASPTQPSLDEDWAIVFEKTYEAH